MRTKSYREAVDYVAENAPTLDKPTAFIKSTEDVAELVAFIYSVDYGTVTEDIVEVAKDIQNYEDE